MSTKLKIFLWFGIPTLISIAWILMAVSNHKLEVEIEKQAQLKQEKESRLNRLDNELESLKRKERRLNHDLEKRMQLISEIEGLRPSLVDLQEQTDAQEAANQRANEERIREEERKLESLQQDLAALHEEYRLVNAQKQWMDLQRAESTSAASLPEVRGYHDLEKVLVAAVQERQTGSALYQTIMEMRSEGVSESEKAALNAKRESLMLEMQEFSRTTEAYQPILNGLRFHTGPEAHGEILAESLIADPQGHHVILYRDGRIEYRQENK